MVQNITYDLFIKAWRPYGVLLIDCEYDIEINTRIKKVNFDFIRGGNAHGTAVGEYDCVVTNYTDSGQIKAILAYFVQNTLKNAILVITNAEQIDIGNEFDQYSLYQYDNYHNFSIISRYDLGDDPYKLITNEPLHLVALCPTYKRPDLLSECIVTFLEQTYRNKSIYVLNDDWSGNIALPFSCSSVIIENANQRFNYLGDKLEYMRVKADGDVFLVWADDDLYLPWRLFQVAQQHVKNDNSVIKHNSALFQCNGAIDKVCNNLEGTASYKRRYFKNARYSAKENLNYELEMCSAPDVSSCDPDPYFWLIMRWSGINYHVSGHGGTYESYQNYENYPCNYPDRLNLKSGYYIWNKMYIENILDPSAQKCFEILKPWYTLM